MLYGSFSRDDLGFSFTHLLKKVVVAPIEYGTIKPTLWIAHNKLATQTAAAAANAYVPGSGAAVTTGLSVVNTATTAQPGAAPGAPPAAGGGSAAGDTPPSVRHSSDGIPKKYLLWGGIGLGALLLLSVIR